LLRTILIKISLIFALCGFAAAQVNLGPSGQIQVKGTLGETHGGTAQSTWTKGDLLCSSGGNTLAKLTVGSNGQYIMADSSQTCGIKWFSLASSDIRALWSGTCDATTYLRGDGSCFAPPGTGTPGGSDTYVQYNDAGSFGGESNFVWDKTNHKLGMGNGSTQATIDFRGGTTAPSNPSANYCRQYFNTTSGVMEWINSSGATCGPSSGTLPANTTATSHQFFTAYNSSTGAFTKAQPAESDLSVTDITTNNASTSAHGFLKKLDNNAAHYMDGTGAWSTPSGSGSSGLPPLMGTGAKRFEMAIRTNPIINGADTSNSPGTVAATTSLPAYIVNFSSGYVEGPLQFLTGKNIHWMERGWLQSTSTAGVRWSAGVADNNTNSGGGSDTPAGKYALFRYHNGTDTQFKCMTSDGTTQTIASSGVNVDTAIHIFEIQFNDSTPNVVFSIDGSVVCTLTTHLPGNGVLVRRGFNVDGGGSTTAFAETEFYIEQDATWP
jgi:hypothetical protein